MRLEICTFKFRIVYKILLRHWIFFVVQKFKTMKTTLEKVYEMGLSTFAAKIHELSQDEMDTIYGECIAEINFMKFVQQCITKEEHKRQVEKPLLKDE